MSERTLFGDVTHEHCDGAADGLIDVDDENLLIVAKKTAHPPLVGKNCPDLHLNYRLVHRANSYLGEQEKQAAHTTLLIPSPASYASDEDFRANGLECCAR